MSPPKDSKPPSFFVSIPVESLESSTEFYKALNFTPLSDFSDDNTAAFRFPYSANSNICLMLHAPSRFQEFVRKGSEIAQPKKATAAIYTLGVGSKDTVDGLLDKAQKAGGKKDPFKMKEYGKSLGIYTRSFEDLDGHIWEATTMLDEKEKGET
ncbi:hypothetical protein CCMA1212_010520 [Trichoderma ghanense]|uniref:VOC domain-containing protein n=1 Tax=Trichoderma ghanense TaxID=65468 RepID=A0ABY2GPI9_9HYPO